MASVVAANQRKYHDLQVGESVLLRLNEAAAVCVCVLAVDIA